MDRARWIERVGRVIHVFAGAGIYIRGVDWGRFNTHTPNVAYQEVGGRPIGSTYSSALVRMDEHRMSYSRESNQ